MKTLDPAVVVYWQRPRRDGSVDFHFQAKGERLRGNIAPAADLDGLRAMFEQHVGVALPEPTGR